VDDATQITLLSMWHHRDNTTQVATRDEVRGSLEHRDLPGDPPFEALVEQGLAEAVEGGWQLTAAGMEIAPGLLHTRARDSFDANMVENVESAASRALSKRISGMDAFCFNILDTAQMRRTVEVLELSAGQRFADLGCAVGTLTDLISRESGATGVGLDFAPRSVAWANAHSADNPLVSFRVGDLNHLELEPAAYDALVAIDTLYFPTDRKQTVKTAFEALAPGGRFVAWYSCRRDPDEDPAIIDAANTPIAQAFDELGATWSAEDFTANAHTLWARAVEATRDLLPAFEAEGRGQQGRGRLREAEALLPFYDAGRGRRWLYVARKPA